MDEFVVSVDGDITKVNAKAKLIEVGLKFLVQAFGNVLLEYLAIYNPRLESSPRSLVINNIKKSAKAYINKMSSINSHDF